MPSHFTQGHQSIFWNGCVERRVWHDEDRGSLEVDGFIGTPLSRRSYNLGFSHCFLSKPLHFLSLPINHPQTYWVPSGQCESEPLLRASQAPFPPQEASENLCSKSEHLAHNRAHQDQDRTETTLDCASTKDTAEPSLRSHVHTPTGQGCSLDLTTSKLLINLSGPQFLICKSMFLHLAHSNSSINVGYC